MKMTIVIENKTVIITDNTPPVFIKAAMAVLKDRENGNK